MVGGPAFRLKGGGEGGKAALLTGFGQEKGAAPQKKGVKTEKSLILNNSGARGGKKGGGWWGGGGKKEKKRTGVL